MKEQQKQEEKKAKREKITEKISVMRQVKQETKLREKDVQEENMKKTVFLILALKLTLFSLNKSSLRMHRR